MGSRILDAGVAVAAVLSAVLLGLMLAAPLLPQAAPVAVATAMPEPSPSADAQLPPIGLYRLREAFFGPCLALQLEPRSYPVGTDAPDGVATVLHWERGMTGCDTRTGEVEEVTASVTRLEDDDAPEETVGYVVGFSLPTPAGVDPNIEVTILAARSTQELIQAIAGAGEGLVFDRVEVVDPPLDPLPTPAVTALQPNGLYLLRGPFNTDGPCLVLDLDETSYPTDPSAAGAASVRWWERAVADPGNPAECLTRSGEVHEVPASVFALRDSAGTPVAYTITFTVGAESGAAQEIEISVPVDASNQDQLVATVVGPEGVPDLAFDRVDSIDPPLGP